MVGGAWCGAGAGDVVEWAGEKVRWSEHSGIELVGGGAVGGGRGRSSWAGAWPLERARGESEAGRWHYELGGACTRGEQEVTLGPRWSARRGRV
jgi:hypothetical protein